MNNKSVFKHLLLLVTALFVLGNISLAQVRTFYVDNQIGSDGYDGLTTSVTLPANGPKLTITNAIAAANDGDFIIVKNTSVPYVQNIVIADGGVTPKVLTIGSSNGTPVVTGTLTLNNTSSSRNLKFNGPIQFSNGMDLVSGRIIGASNLTIGVYVTRTDTASVDTQILLAANGVNYTYTGTTSYTTGFELPAAGARTIGSLTTNTAGVKLTLDRNVSMTGTLTVGTGNMDLGGFILSTNAAIAAGTYNIVNGVIAATANGQTFTAHILPNVTATKATSSLATVTIGVDTMGTLSSTLNASVTAAVTGLAGDVSFAGAGIITISGVSNIGNVTATDSVNVVIAAKSIKNLTTTVGNFANSKVVVVTLSGGTDNTAANASVRGTVTNNGKSVVVVDRSAGAALYISGNIVNTGAGTISLGAINATAYDIAGDITLNGAGSIDLQGAVIASYNTLHNLTTGASSTGTINVNAATPTAYALSNVTLGGTGNINLNGALVTAYVVGNVTSTGSGTIEMGGVSASTYVISGSVALSGTGLININGASATNATVSGSVTLSSALLSANTSNKAVITFGNFPTAIAGSVSNSATFTGAIDSGATRTNNAVIAFGATDALVSFGSISNTADLTGATYGLNALLTNSGNINFAWTGATQANKFTVGSVTNGAKYLSPAANGTGNGNISLSGVSATATAPITTGAIVNSSTIGSTTSITNCLIDFRAVGGSAITAASVQSTGGYGGDIQFGIDTVTVTGGITTDRTQIGADILFGAATSGTTFTAGSISNSGKSAVTITSVVNAPVLVSGGVTVSGTGSVTIPNDTSGNVTVSGAVSVTGTGGFTAAALTTANVTFGSLNVGNGTLTMRGAGTGTFTINGTTISGGAVVLPSGVGAFGNYTQSGGTLTLSVSGSALTTLNFQATSGTMNLGTFARTLTIKGLTHKIGDAAGVPTFTNCALTTIVVGNPIPDSTATVTMGSQNPTWPGLLTVLNTSDPVKFPTAVIFTGGNLFLTSTAGKVNFSVGGVLMNGTKLYIASNTGSGDFTNTSGYSTINNGFISIAAAASTPSITGVGSFGDFEVFSGPATGTVGFATPIGNFKGNFYLTSGVVDGTNVKFNNPVLPYPTIVRNAGSFLNAPVFNSFVNVTYIGIDKATGLEVPVDSLYNLEVATTRGGTGAGTTTSGKGLPTRGVVTITSGKVNGMLTVRDGQVLALATGANLTLNGPTANIIGDLVNLERGDTLILAAANGTTITGKGLLPPVKVAAGSVGNMLTGQRGLVDVQLGADNTIGGADDIILSDSSASNGFLVFGNGNASLTAGFSAVTLWGSHVDTVITLNAGNGLTLGSNLVINDKLTHAAGTINVATYTLSLFGKNASSQDFTSGAKVIGTGTLSFVPPVAGTVLNVFTAADTIDANVSVNGSLGLLTLASANNNLVLNGNLSLIGGNGVAIGTGRVLTARGANVSMASGTGFTGSGTLKLDAAVPPLTFTFLGTPSLQNVRISNSVTLAGDGTQLTVTDTLTHDAGVLDFGSRTLAAQGIYRRTTGTYSATSGFFVFSGTKFNNGTVADTIPNFRLLNTAVVDTVHGNSILQVSKIIEFKNTAQFGGLVNVSDLATVNYYTSGGLYYNVGYDNTVTMNLLSTTNSTIPGSVWPVIAKLVTTLNLNPTSGVTVTLPSGSDRTVNTNLILNKGILNTNDNLAYNSNGILVNVNDGALTGTVVYNGSKTSVVYGGTLAHFSPTALHAARSVSIAFGGRTTGNELPDMLTNLRFTRSINDANFSTFLSKVITVMGTLNINNDLTTTFASTNNALSVQGDVNIVKDTIALNLASATNATTPVTTFGGDLTFTGPNVQALTYPDAGITIGGNLAISKDSAQNVVNMHGGDLVVSGKVNFINGLLYTGVNAAGVNNSLVLSNPVGFGAGFTHAIAVGNLSHVVGSVRQTLKEGVIISAGRNEFPVGDLHNYRPATLTFINDQIPNQSLGIAATVRYNSSKPTGIVGLPIANGVKTGLDVSRFPDFSWSIATNGSLTGTHFNLELTAEGYTDFNQTTNLVDDARIIRRAGGVLDVVSPWSLQGTTYDNFVIDGIPTVTNTNSVGGLLPGGAIFTYGLKSTLVINNPIAAQTLTVGGASFTTSVVTPPVFGGSASITYSASSSNVAVATASVVGGVLTVVPVGAGTATITVVGNSLDQGQITTTFGVTVNPGAVAFKGKVVYDNATQTGIGGVTVTLTPATGTAVTAATDTAGNYSFTGGVLAGTYTLTASKALGKWAQSDVNSTDALWTVQNYTGTRTFDALQTAAGDVNNSTAVNATDALLIVQRFAGVTSSFVKGDWTFESKVVTVGNVAIDSLNIKGLAIGDLNKSSKTAGASFAKTIAASVNIEAAKTIDVAPKATFSVPMQSVSAMTLGAVSLKINYPADVVTFTGVSSTKLAGVVASAEEGVISIGWANMDAKSVGAQLKDNDVLLSLNFTAKVNKGSVALTTASGSEFADAEGNVIGLAKLAAGSVEIGAVPSVFELSQNYPNPFNPTTEIKYSVAEAGRVTLAIYNIMGQEVGRLVSGMQEAGFYKVQWNAAGMASGVYIYRLQVDNKFTQSKRLTLLK